MYEMAKAYFSKAKFTCSENGEFVMEGPDFQDSTKMMKETSKWVALEGGKYSIISKDTSIAEINGSNLIIIDKNMTLTFEKN